MSVVLATQRLVLRHLEPGDAAFILELVNDPEWLRHIGDKQVRTLDAARAYIENGPTAMVARHGFGLYLVQVRETQQPIGLCGLIRRDGLDDVDLGFAFLPVARGQGYAREAAAATIRHAFEQLQLPRIAAITTPGNKASIRLLQHLGLDYERPVRLSPDGELLNLYLLDAPGQP